MRLIIQQLQSILLLVTLVVADFSGPAYPPPSDLSSNQSHVFEAFQNLTTALSTYLSDTNETSPTAALKNFTFSIGLFSVPDPAAREQQFHYTSPEVANGTNGTRKVDGDSIYNIASVSKLFTVFAGLLELSESDWNTPLTEINPLFKQYVEQNPKTNLAITVQWDTITPAALAAQIAGVPRDILPGSPGEILTKILIATFSGQTPLDPTTLGLPRINETDTLAYPPCTPYIISDPNGVCPEEPWIESVVDRPPTFLPWTTPGYSDIGFALLGLAISNITGKSMDEIYRDRIFVPLGMTGSNSTTPPESEWYRAVIPGALESFVYDAGLFVASGGLSSTINDLAEFGINILNSTLLPSDQTRKWMKPKVFTDRFEYSVGSPWEIMRYTHPSGHITDIYPKSGDSGSYSSWFVTIPDYNAGFSILVSGTSLGREVITSQIADIVASLLIPALEIQATEEAEKNFGGTFSSTTQGSNSSITIVSNKTQGAAPGLFISSWISNNTDVLTALESTLGRGPWRLLPTIHDEKSRKQAFRIVTKADAPSTQVPGKLFSGLGYLAADWIGLDSLSYGGIAVPLFLYDIGNDGIATSVKPGAFRATLSRFS